MKNTRQASVLWICGCLLALLFALPAAGQTGGVVKVENLVTKLAFYPIVEGEYERIILTVTGPCNFVYRDLIKPGDVGVFSLSEETIDDVYTFEAVSIPVVEPELVEVLQQARKEDEYSEVNALCRAGKLPGAPLTQSEAFRVLNGKIVYDPFAEEDPRGYAESQQGVGGVGGVGGGSDPLNIPLKDFVINDDLIVDGSACIGFDCVNGESFSFDTIRLKENNLRIKFDDTSVAASFPRTDWQLTANASANGGASKFSIDDISGSRTPFTVEANARSHSLYVDDGGRIGNRTSTPSTEIHTIDGDTPTLRLQQDGSSGFAPQTWDVAGNETNFFIRDVSNGSTLPFRIRPGAPTSSIFVDVDGDVGFGTATPDTIGVDVNLALFEAGNNPIRLGFKSGSGDGWIIVTNPDASGDSQMIWSVTDDLAGVMTLDDTGALSLDGTLNVGDTNTGGGAGTDACIDSSGLLCACGSCG